MGQQQTKAKAINVLHQALEQAEPPLSPEQKESIARYFENVLSK